MIIICTDYILTEIGNSLARVPLRGIAIKLIDFIRGSNTVELVMITPELFARSYQLYCSRDDKEWGLTDCSSFLIMQEMKIKHAFTADRHFEQAGFTILLK